MIIFVYELFFNKVLIFLLYYNNIYYKNPKYKFNINKFKI